MTIDDNHSVRRRVMDAIRKGDVHMKPRWYFALLSALVLTGVAILLLTLLYIASLGIFFLRDSGTLFAPSFGDRGWWTLLHSLPWTIIVLAALFAVVLEFLVRRYAFVYKKPLLTSAVGILALALVGGFLITQTPLHRVLLRSARMGMLPPPFNILYEAPLHMPPPGDVYHGAIISTTSLGFIMLDEGGAGTTTIVITPDTRLPYGEDFSVGERVLVIGDTASDSVRAFGVREIDEYQPDMPPPPPYGRTP